ncbi:hypothetical protein Hanom_Chr03g00249451 [Helianthus anomalus]
MAWMSLLWRDIGLYLSFRRDDEGEWSLFDFVDPPRHATLKAADHVIGEHEPDVLKIHLEQFLLPVVPADLAAYVSQPSPSVGSSVSAAEAKKTIQHGHGGRGLRHYKWHFCIRWERCYSAARVQVEGVSSTPLEITPSAGGEPSLSALISQASAAAVVSCPVPPPMPITAMAVTTSPVSTPLPSSTPTVFAAHEATSAGDTTMDDAGGSSSGIADDGACLGDDLYLPTINWDPNVPDKRYQPRWKIAESSRLIPPPSDSTLG